MTKRLNRSRGNFSLDIDLISAFGGEVPEDIALAFGQEIIDRILERTESNVGSDDKRYQNYSEEYADTLDFMAAGKSRTNPNLDLTGDMLADIDILEASPGKITIGFSDTLQRDKAYNHHTGDTVPSRPFLDLPDEVYRSIVNDFKSDIERREEPGSGPTASTVSLLELLERIDGES
jgi:hypothetical protein